MQIVVHVNFELFLTTCLLGAVISNQPRLLLIFMYCFCFFIFVFVFLLFLCANGSNKAIAFINVKCCFVCCGRVFKLIRTDIEKYVYIFRQFYLPCFSELLLLFLVISVSSCCCCHCCNCNFYELLSLLLETVLVLSIRQPFESYLRMVFMVSKTRLDTEPACLKAL